MIKLYGRENCAICYSDIIDEKAKEQIKTICDFSEFKESKIRIMPDVHAGKGCTIGTTMTILDKVVPSMVGVDIGCGMYVLKIGNVDIDFLKLDEICHKIPSGQNVWDKVSEDFDLKRLRCFDELKEIKWLKSSLGTLGGGNHFIEIDIDEENNKYLVIHSGSRNLGSQVANIYQNKAYELLKGKKEYLKRKEEIIRIYKEIGRKREIQSKLKMLETEYINKEPKMPYELCYLYGEAMEDYLYDIEICQEFARLNREKMARIIVDYMNFNVEEAFHTIHNYIDTREMILRKGAISARLNEKILIPINMKEGSLVCIGKGNKEWNYSAPHGAGRILSRGDAKSTLTMEEYKKEMEGIYSTCINEKTLDEAPMAYKSIDDIINNIKPTAEIVKIIKPIYNFKAS